MADQRVVLIGAAADPLSVRAVFFCLILHRRTADDARYLFMVALLIIMFATIGLAVRAVVYRNQWSAADAESANETGLVDTCGRAFVLVFISLLGLMALGIMYGNVLGSASANP